MCSSCAPGVLDVGFTTESNRLVLIFKYAGALDGPRCAASAVRAPTLSWKYCAVSSVFGAQ